MGFLSRLSGQDKLEELYAHALEQGTKVASSGGGIVVLAVRKVEVPHPGKVIALEVAARRG